MKIEYRDFVIYPCEYGGFEFHKKHYDGDPVSHANTLEEAKQEIDDLTDSI